MKTKKKSSGRLNGRAMWVGGLFMLWLALIGARAGYLQIYRGAWLSRQAAEQYEDQLVVPGKRGTIYDAQHQAMAVSIETTSVCAYPGMIEDKAAAAAGLAKAMAMKSGHLQQLLDSGRSFVWIKRQATPRETAAVRKLNIKGIDFVAEHSRFYPNTTLAGQVLGFTGIDGHGLEGLEFYYDKELSGPDHKILVYKDALGRRFETDRRPAGIDGAGSNLVLTIDSRIQYIAEGALADAVTRSKAASGMALVMEPTSGAILAMADYPQFNPNNFRKYDRTDWRNRAITDAFEPGSTMKIFSAAAALQDGGMTSNTIFFCENGRYLVGDHYVNDTKPHGWLSLQQIVKYSSNIGAVKIAQRLGAETLYDQFKSFGFGERTDVDCPGEAGGSLSSYKSWTSVDTGAIAFGQGVSVTALQLVTAVSAVANGGVLMRPYLVQQVVDGSSRPLKTFEPHPQRRVISAETAHALGRILRSVVADGGTGTQADLEGYPVAGKTGTAQKVDARGGYTKDRYVASFIGFAPVDHPALVVLVVVDEPKETHYGGLVAAPAFRQIVKESLSYLNIAPSMEDMPGLQLATEIVRTNG